MGDTGGRRERPKRALLIEDGSTAARIAAGLIRGEGLTFVRERSALGARCAFRVCGVGGLCVAIVDLGLPRSETDPTDCDGFDVIDFLKTNDPGLSIVAWTASIDPQKTARARALDVDLLDKANVEGLGRAIRRSLLIR